VLGGLIVVTALPLALTVRESPDGASQVVRPADRAPIGDVLRSPALYLLIAGSMCSIAAVGGTNQHLKLFLSLDHGYAQSDAAKIASLVLLSSLAGRLLMGWLADHIAKKYVMLIIYLLVAVSIPLLFGATTRETVFVFAVIFGLGLGGEYMIIPLMAAELFNARVLGRALGIVLTADGVAEAAAPYLVGRMRDASGSYFTGFTMLIGFAVVGGIAIALLPRVRRESSASASAALEVA
jgi:sugar phosphate permease